MKIGFVMDAVGKLDVKGDSSSFIMREALRRGHEVVYLEAAGIFIEDHEPQGHGFVPGFEDGGGVIEKILIGEEKLYKLRDFDVILNRKDPPFDMNYIYLTYVLELVKKDVFVMNDPSGVRSANEKFWALNFPEFIPDTLVTRRSEDIERFLGKCPERGVVMKPLDSKGGDGIFFLNPGDVNKNELMKMMTGGGGRYVMVQEFIEEVRETGDKRILLLNGEVMSSFARVPKKGDFRGNLSAGASSHKVDVSAEEVKMCEKLRPFLVENGLWLVGLDVIGGYITEINVTSPIIGFRHHPENGGKIVEFLEGRD